MVSVRRGRCTLREDHVLNLHRSQLRCISQNLRSLNSDLCGRLHRNRGSRAITLLTNDITNEQIMPTRGLALHWYCRLRTTLVTIVSLS
jgi:hypothetical protein